MNALEFIVNLLGRGVTFTVDADRLRFRDPDNSTTEGERALISALKPAIRSLLLTELPPERLPRACPAFSAAKGVALCRDCGFALPDHYWRTPTCSFFVGAPATVAICRRCGLPWLEHLAIEAQS